jgi:hypothetical protein
MSKKSAGRVAGILKFFSLLLAVAIAIASIIFFTRPGGSKLPELQDGDIVFQTSTSSQSAAIFAATKSPFTHMGIIKLTENGPVVIEAVGPVRETPFQEWVNRGLGWRLVVMRMGGLEDWHRKKIITEAFKYYGLPYDPYFIFGPDSFYCSELVWQIFRDAGKDLGRVQKISELDLNRTAVLKLIEERWQNYPPCKDAISLEVCHEIIRYQDLITPATIADDSGLYVIWSNYGPLTP